MSDTTAGNGSTFIANTDEVRGVGRDIANDATELIGADDPIPNTLQDFLNNFNKIKQTNFPDALQTTLGDFIQKQHDGYCDILQNRQAIGLVLQNKVATDTEVTETMTKQQFQQQLTNIQQGSW